MRDHYAGCPCYGCRVATRVRAAYPFTRLGLRMLERGLTALEMTLSDVARKPEPKKEGN